jgi:hypothetical protein
MGLPCTFSSLSLTLALAANCCIDTAFEPVTFETSSRLTPLARCNRATTFADLLSFLAPPELLPGCYPSAKSSVGYFAKSLILLAGVAGLEPATPGFGDRCSTN